MDHNARMERLSNLYDNQSGLFHNAVPLPSQYSEYKSLTDYIPAFNEDFNIDDYQLNDISDLKKFDDSVFAKWKAADLPVMIVAGALGTLSSVLLKDFFADIHDKLGNLEPDKGGHAKDKIDRVPPEWGGKEGKSKGGGGGHRFRFGHDILNPFEIDWSQYEEIARSSSYPLPIWLKKIFFWFRHLFQDTFSEEGLPLPGHSLLRYLFNLKNPKTVQVLRKLVTIKMRDIAGSAITNIAMGAYLWGTEKDIKRVVCEPNYRAYSLMLGANLITLLSGLLIPLPNTSLNWGCIPIIGYYSYHLIKLEKRIQRELSERDNTLNKNDQILMDNAGLLNSLTLFNDEEFNTFLEYEKEVEVFYRITVEKHQSVKAYLKGE